MRGEGRKRVVVVLARGLEDEEEVAIYSPVSTSYWQKGLFPLPHNAAWLYVLKTDTFFFISREKRTNHPKVRRK